MSTFKVDYHDPDLWLVRSIKPNEMDTVPYGSICKVILGNLVYIQLSHDEEKPSWIRVGEYCEDTPNEVIIKDIDKMFEKSL